MLNNLNFPVDFINKFSIIRPFGSIKPLPGCPGVIREGGNGCMDGFGDIKPMSYVSQ